MNPETAMPTPIAHPTPGDRTADDCQPSVRPKPRTPRHRFVRLAAWVTGGLCLAAPLLAQADSDERAARVPPLPAYQQECAACHVAYPSRLLPAASWSRLMNNLPRHFGTDASLDPATTRQIAQWLEANAGTGKRVTGPIPEDRITRSPWFLREHREVPAAVWQRANIKSASNCAACHTRAADGRYSESEVQVPAR